MQWRGRTYVDKVLPFGLRSAPKLYKAIANGVLWILDNTDQVMCIHYLDDFLLFGSPDSCQCGVSLERALARCKGLGVPIAPAKTEGPATKLTFLGIELDTASLTISLPQEKLERLCTMIRDWESKKSCTKRELLSLIGYLQHACLVIKPGRSFLRQMIDLSAGARALHHRVRQNAGFRSDLKWWNCFCLCGMALARCPAWSRASRKWCSLLMRHVHGVAGPIHAQVSGSNSSFLIAGQSIILR